MSKWEDDLKLVKEAYPDLGEEFGSSIDGLIKGSASVGMDLYDKMTLPKTFGSTSPADLYEATGHIRTYPERFGEGLMKRDTSGTYAVPSPGEEAIRDFYMSDDEGMAGPAIPPGGYPHYSTEPSGEATMYDEDEWRRMIRESGRRPAPVAAAEVSPYMKISTGEDPEGSMRTTESYRGELSDEEAARFMAERDLSGIGIISPPIRTDVTDSGFIGKLKDMGSSSMPVYGGPGPTVEALPGETFTDIGFDTSGLPMADRLKSIEDGTAFEGMKEGGWGVDGLAAAGAIPGGGALIGGTLGAVGGMLARGGKIHKALTGSRIPGTAGTVDEYARAKAATAAGDDARLAAGEFAFPVGERGPISWLADVPVLGPISKWVKEVFTRDVDVLSSMGMLTSAGKISSTAERELVSKVAKEVYGESTLATRAAVKKRLADELPDHDLSGVPGRVASKATDYFSAMAKAAMFGKTATEYARTVPKSTLDDFVGPGKLKAGKEIVGSGVDAAFRRGMGKVSEEMFGKMSTSALKGGGVGAIGGIGVGAALDAEASSLSPEEEAVARRAASSSDYVDPLAGYDAYGDSLEADKFLGRDYWAGYDRAEDPGKKYLYSPGAEHPFSGPTSFYGRGLEGEPLSSGRYIPSYYAEDYYKLPKETLEGIFASSPSIGTPWGIRSMSDPERVDYAGLLAAIGYKDHASIAKYGEAGAGFPGSYELRAPEPVSDYYKGILADMDFKTSPHFGGPALPPEVAAEILGGVMPGSSTTAGRSTHDR